MSTININIGILGHIDSGKTSIARALSSEASTAAFDKSPQSQERGITLDLGFSAFTVPLPADSRLVTEHGYANAQFTLVDCPGHASLIRTIIGGSQIMDAMLLVIDAVKGIQTQTSEGIVIGSLATSKLVVALNKVDQLSAPGAVKKASERLGKVLSATPFAGAPIIPVAAAPRVADGCGDNDGDGSSTAPPRGIDKLRDALLGMVDESILAKRAMGAKEPFLMAVDHCFTVKGQGTVVTGTVLRGDLKPNDTVEVPELKTQHKVKSIQMFRKPVQSASLGDRIGVALPSLDAKTFERGIVAAPRSVPTVHAVVGRVEKIPYFKEECMSKEKFHITVGHSTVMASVMFFGSAVEPWSREREHVYLDALPPKGTETWVLLEFEKPLSCPTGAVFIGSHLDSDINKNSCRIAFHGKVVDFFDKLESAHETIMIYKPKMKEGTVDRVVDSHSIIMKGMFKKEASPTLYVGLKVYLKKEGEEDREGRIDSPFGKSGKYKVVFGTDFEIKSPKQVVGLKLVLCYKKFLFKKSNKIIQ